MKRSVFLFLTLAVWLFAGSPVQGKASASVKIRTKGFTRGEVLDFAGRELEDYLSRAMKQNGRKEKMAFTFICNKSLPDGSFVCKTIAPGRYSFEAADPMGISHAVYTFLEQLGYTFDLSRTLVPAKYDFDKVQKIDTMVVPRVRWRGIRQHVNFPMDLSSYPIEEAKDYIDNMVRLRFNKLVVHSYPGFWHEQPQADSTLYGGNFFYDSPHFYGNNPFLRKYVRFNDSLYCIPTMESFYFEKVRKSRAAIAWMYELLAHAKRRGLYIQFSIEPRNLTEVQTVSTVGDILKNYPMIDAMELITEEMGGWGNASTREGVTKTLTRYFGKEILDDPVIAQTVQKPGTDLNDLYAQLGNNMASLRKLRAEHPSKQFKLGIYCTTRYALPAYHLVRSTMPDVAVVIMPSHGSDGVDRVVRQMVKTVRDMKQTELYSWIEFDGLMYLQQNAANGIGRLLSYVDSLAAGQPIPSVCFNHWRTCENRITARYAAEVSLKGTEAPATFYRTFARRVGIGREEAFADIMERINQWDSYATGHLGNIGFCWTGAWRHPGLYRGMNLSNLDKTIGGYEEISGLLSSLLAQHNTPEACSVLSLLENRVQATALYLEAFKAGTEIRTIKTANLSDAEKKTLEKICNRAMEKFGVFMEKYAELLPDRGSEGVLVSTWNAPVYGLKLVRRNLAGVPMERDWHNDRPVDSPPLPINENDLF